MARANSSGCSITLLVMVGCEPGVSKIPYPSVMLRRLSAMKCIDRPPPKQAFPRRALFLRAAPVHEEAGDGRRRGEQFADADVLVGGVRHVHVSCAVHHARHAPEVDKETHVRAVGDAFDGGLLPRHPLVGLLYDLADRGVGVDFGGGELAAEPSQLGWVLP